MYGNLLHSEHPQARFCNMQREDKAKKAGGDSRCQASYCFCSCNPLPRRLVDHAEAVTSSQRSMTQNHAQCRVFNVNSSRPSGPRRNSIQGGFMYGELSSELSIVFGFRRATCSFFTPQMHRIAPEKPRQLLALCDAHIPSVVQDGDV